MEYLWTKDSLFGNQPFFYLLSYQNSNFFLLIFFSGLFIINEKGVIRHITHNDPPVGRNVDEVLRLVKAYKFTDEHGEVCPAGWQPGKATMKPDPVGSKTYFESQN